MLKLKLQYFDHLMWRADSFEKTLMLGKIEDRRRSGWQTMRWLDGITDSMDVNLRKHQGYGKWQGSLECCSSWGHNESEKAEFQETSTSATLTTLKPLAVWITTTCGKFLKRDHLICLLRNLYAAQEATVRTGLGTTDWFQIGKGVCQGWILSPCLFNLYQSRSYEMPGWMTHKLESRLPEEISITSDTQMTPPLWQKVKRN